MGSTTGRGWLLAALGVMLATAVMAEELGGHSCPADPDGKSGACGRAMAWSEAGKEGNPIPFKAQADTDITHCFLDIEINTSAKTVTGSNTLEVTSKINGLTQFTVDLRSNMTVSSVLVNGAAAGYTRPTNQILINLGATYNIGQSFTVKVSYSGTPSNLGWQSFRFSTHGSPSTSIVCSLSQPWWAHTWWPCKENQADVDDKFTMDIWVTVPKALVVASNGLLQGVDNVGSTKKRYRWRESHPIPTYLVSVAATNYTQITRYYTHGDVVDMPVELYTYPETATADQAATADLVNMIEVFSDAYGEYPFADEKYGIARFSWCCGMEHQTMTSQGSIEWRTNIHELAHSWWGDMVTCKSWHDIWLNEGFATFSEALWLEKKPGGSYFAYIDHLTNLRKPTDISGTVYCYDISDYSRVFSQNFSYKKGGWVVHMLRRVLGDPTFFQVLADYRNTYQYRAADTLEFQAVAEMTSGRDLDWFFDEWVYGPGAPSYEHGWQAVQIGSQNWVRCYIRQTQTSYPLFTMPYDVTVTTLSGSTTTSVWNHAAQQWYLLPADGAVSNVQFDKDIWILKEAVSPVSYVNGPPKLVSSVPAPGTTVAAGQKVSAIELQFSEPITCTAGDFSVTGSVSGTQSFTLGYDNATFKASLAFATPLTGEQIWVVRVSDTVKSQAASAALDGEIADPVSAASLPSGDGVPGGAAIFQFGTPEELPDCHEPFADADGDGDVDMDDFGAFQACLTGPGDGGGNYNIIQCHCFDLDGDWDVDSLELGVFRNCLSGAGVAADPACDDAWLLFADDFDTGGSGAAWRVLGSSSDYTANFDFDYSTLGIPPAPRSVGGTRTGLKFTVNKNDDAGAIEAVSAFPLNRQFSGNYTLSFDMWIDYVGSGATTGSTEMMNAGINTPANQVIWPSNPANGYFAAVAGDGDDGSGQDYRLYRGATILTAGSGTYAAGTASTALDHVNAFYLSLFPNPPAPIAGTPGKQWVAVELGRYDGIVTWKLNGTIVATLADSSYPAGNIMLGYMDLFASIPSPKDQNYIIYDNVTVTGRK